MRIDKQLRQIIKEKENNLRFRETKLIAKKTRENMKKWNEKKESFVDKVWRWFR